MKQVTAETTEIWLSGDYSESDRRPYSRATIQRLHIKSFSYEVPSSYSMDWNHNGTFRSALFGQDSQPKELYNIKSIDWNRTVDQDAASCTITLYNTRILQAVDEKPNDEDFDQPGFYTPNRGDEPFFMNRWGYVANHWNGWLLPDRLVRTYEGYGLDVNEAPEVDPHMYPSGVWLIDQVTLNSSGDIVLTCRDIGRLLLDQILFPPIVPNPIYPLTFAKRALTDDQPEYTLSSTISPAHDSDSNLFYVGVPGLDPDQEVGPGGLVNGHTAADAFDGNATTWWLSNGQRRRNFVYIEGVFPSQTVSAVRLNVRGGPYRVFVSLWNGSEWLGAHVIPYTVPNNGVDIQARIKYTDEFVIAPGDHTFKLNTSHASCRRVRFTFTDLPQSSQGDTFPCRVSVREAYVGEVGSLAAAGPQRMEGSYSDYTDIVKWLCAWAGFYWPAAGTGQAFVRYRDIPEDIPLEPASNDPLFGKGRVWGDFMRSGTAGPVPLGVETFDKKPVMDGINAVKEILGFDFWIDETGGVVWRLANLYKKGNYLMPDPGVSRSAIPRTTDVVVIDERTTMIEYNVTLSSTNVRERIFVADVGGNFGYTVHGYNPVKSGMVRVTGWTDQHFRSREECQRMAEMIAIRQAMTYRTGKVTIAANPAIQIDDQVRLYERHTGEGYLHRVTGITSHYDNEDGAWTYELDTHWLGDEPFTKWAFDPKDLSAVTRNYLHQLGAIEQDGSKSSSDMGP